MVYILLTKAYHSSSHVNFTSQETLPFSSYPTFLLAYQICAKHNIDGKCSSHLSGYICTDGFDCQLHDYALLQNHSTPLSQCIQWMGHTSSPNQQLCDCVPFLPDCAKCTATPVTTPTSTSTTTTVKGRTTNKQHLEIESHIAIKR